jgi:hypothetical protein
LSINYKLKSHVDVDHYKNQTDLEPPATRISELEREEI